MKNDQAEVLKLKSWKKNPTETTQCSYSENQGGFH